jgi:hypothetical protein
MGCRLKWEIVFPIVFPVPETGVSVSRGKLLISVMESVSTISSSQTDSIHHHISTWWWKSNQAQDFAGF